MGVRICTGEPASELVPRPFFHESMGSQCMGPDADLLSSADAEKEWLRRSRESYNAEPLPPKMLLISYEDSAPAPRPPVPPEHDAVKRRVRRTISALQELLEHRPVVSRRVLEECTDLFKRESKHVAVEDVLIEAVYGFKNGPFAKYVVRLGYDCRRQPQSCIYQAVSFAIKEEEVLGWSSRLHGRYGLGMDRALVNLDSMQVVDNAHDNPLYRRFFGSIRISKDVYRIVIFGTLLTSVTSMQICSMSDEGIWQLFAGDKRNAECGRKHGWITEKLETRLKEAVMNVIRERVNTLAKRPIDDAAAKDGPSPPRGRSSSSSVTTAPAPAADAVSNPYDLLASDSEVNRWHRRYQAVALGSGVFESKKDRRLRLGFPARQLSRENALRRRQERQRAAMLAATPAAMPAAMPAAASSRAMASAETYYMTSDSEEEGNEYAYGATYV